MNVKLLRKIQKHILAEPKRLDMAVVARDMSELKPNQRPPCGTTACIAGWAIVLGTKKKLRQFDNFLMDSLGHTYGADDAGELLEFDGDQENERLFFVRSWPSKFAIPYKTATCGKKAKIASARIDHFIKTKGAE